MSAAAPATVPDEPSRTYPTKGVHGRLVEVIGQRIVGDAMAPGTDLPRELELMDEFQASRTAVREAIKVLAAKGLVESRQKRGMRVRAQDDWNLLDPDVLAWCAASSPSAELVGQMVELRQMIEPAAARLAAERRSAGELAAIEKAFADMAAGLDDLVAYYRADLAFHRALFRASGNPFIDRLGAIVAVILEVSFRLQQRSLIPASSGLALHEPVLSAIRDRDPPAAEAAMQAIIEAAGVELRAATGTGGH
jgi:DNA-binding FadR family transcriptional regulator